MLPIFLSNKKCRLEHVVNKLMSCLITEFLWIFSYKLHGILSNSMDTLWHSMELHQYFREPHGIPWNSTIFHGISWHSMELHHYFMELRGTPWHSMELHGYSMDTPWEFRGIPWISMDFHGIPWRYFTRVGRVPLLGGLESLFVCHDIKEAKCFYIYNNFPSLPLIANTLDFLVDNISVISSFHPN